MLEGVVEGGERGVIRKGERGTLVVGTGGDKPIEERGG